MFLRKKNFYKVLVLVGCWLSFWIAPSHAAVSVTVGMNFTGSEFGVDSTAIPADCNGAMGPQHFVEFINGSFAAYNRTNPAQVTRMSDLIFWNDAGVSLAGSQITTDPRVLYDPTVQRWFASMIDADGGALDPTLSVNDFLFAVSDTADPTGTWHGFKFRSDPTTSAFADFPTLGVDSNAVYLSAEMYHGEDNPLGTGLVSIPKADLVASTPTITNRTWFGVMSYGNRGQVVQPSICFDGSATGKMIATSDYGNDSDPHSNLVSFAVLNGSGPGATLTPSTLVPTLPWVVPDSLYVPAPAFGPIQPDGSDTLDGNDARLSSCVYAVRGVEYAVHCTLENGRVALRWYRIRAVDNVLLESGTISDPDLDLFFPSIAANAAGVVVIGFNGCGLNTYISCFALVGQTVDGVTTFGDRLLLQASNLSYHDLYEQGEFTTYSRWGDYSTTTVDPSDPNRFWTIQMFAKSSELFDTAWATQITELITTPPIAPVLLAISVTGTNVTVSWPISATGYQLQSATNMLPMITWTDVVQSPQTNGNVLSVVRPASSLREFFRLKK